MGLVAGIGDGFWGDGGGLPPQSYYLSELRSKMAEIGREIKVLTDESAKLTRDSQVFASLERRYEERVTEVRQLEGQLADFNLAFDKVRAAVSVGFDCTSPVWFSHWIA